MCAEQIASLLLRLPFYLFPNPIATVLEVIESRVWSLEWCSICVEELGRAGISDLKKYANTELANNRNALQRHLDGDMPAVMRIMIEAMSGSEQEAEAACKCAESWVGYGISAE